MIKKILLFPVLIILAAAVHAPARTNIDTRLQALLEEGQEMVDQGQLEEAGEHFLELISRYQNHSDPQIGLLKVAGIYKEQGNIEKAFEWLKRGIETADEKSRLHLTISVEYVQIEDIPKALYHLREAVNEGFDSGEILATALWVYSGMEMYNDESLRVAKQLETLERRPFDSLLFMGLWNLNNDKPQEAIALYRKAVRVDTNNVRVRLLLGEAYEHIENYDLARREYIKVIHSAPNHPAGYMAMASLSEKTGEKELAAEYRRIVEEIHRAHRRAAEPRRQPESEPAR